MGLSFFVNVLNQKGSEGTCRRQNCRISQSYSGTSARTNYDKFFLSEKVV